MVPALAETLPMGATTTVWLVTTPVWFVIVVLAVVVAILATRWNPTCESVEPAACTNSSNSTGKPNRRSNVQYLMAITQCKKQLKKTRKHFDYCLNYDFSDLSD